MTSLADYQIITIDLCFIAMDLRVIDIDLCYHR